jgi:hypothetical protein
VSVDVGVRDLIRSYVELREESAKCGSASSHLLLFYAVECGLKAAVLGKRGRNARSTADLPSELRSHDLRRLAKELKLAGSVLPSRCQRCHDAQTAVNHQEMHQAWRYGALLEATDETAFVKALTGLSEWCRKEHDR